MYMTEILTCKDIWWHGEQLADWDTESETISKSGNVELLLEYLVNLPTNNRANQDNFQIRNVQNQIILFTYGKNSEIP